MTEKSDRHFSIAEASEMTGVDRSIVVIFIQREWISPASEDELDEADIARINLIHELQAKMGANEESIPIILHLLDQLYFLRRRIREVSP